MTRAGETALHDWTVVVARRAEQAGPTEAALRAAGAEVHVVETTRIVDPPDGGAGLVAAVSEVARFAWVAFTSVNAVERVRVALGDLLHLAPCRVAAVGPATAAALRKAGREPDLVAGESRGTGLAAAFPDAPEGEIAAVLLPRSAAAADDLPEALAARGWHVVCVDAYGVDAAKLSSESVTLLQCADAVVLAAPSAVESLVSQGVLPVVHGRAPIITCIGPVTAAAARSAGLAPVAEAAGPVPSAVVDAIAAARARAPGAPRAPGGRAG